MEQINATIKQIRKKQELTQEQMAKRLCMARSTYSKVESGVTEMNYKTLLQISKSLNIPLMEIIKKDDPSFCSLSEKLDLMLVQMEHHFSEMYYKIIPFDKLTREHFELLRKHNLHKREDYENTPLKGRIYKYGPKELFDFMMSVLSLDVLFEENLITNREWLQKWKNHKNKTWPAIEIDSYDYFEVLIVLLKMPDNHERWIQIATRDFPEEVTDSEENLINFLKKKTGAVSGEFIASTMDGYDLYTEIIK